MPQHDLTVDNATFPTVRADINSGLQALGTLSSGATAPATTFAYMLWADTTTGLLKIRNAANSAWVSLGTMASTNLGHLSGTLTSTLTMSSAAINEAQGADIASAGTTDIGAMTGNQALVNGTTTISAFGTVQSGARRTAVFTGILTLTYNATSMVLPGAADITTQAGDVAIFVSRGSGNWRCVSYLRADGTAVVPDKKLVGLNTQTGDYTLVLADAGKMVEGNKATTLTFTVPPNSSVAFPLNTRVDLTQYGAGQLVVAAGVGVTIRSSGAKLKIKGQYSGATLYKRGTDEWYLVGDIAA